MRLVQAAVVALVGALALVGCTPAPVVTPTPTPVPTFQCTPEAGGTASPCSQAQFDEMKRLDALYAEAEELNRRLRVEFETMYRQGGFTELPPGLTSILAGTAVDDALELGRLVHERKSMTVSGEAKVLWVRRNVGATKEGSELSLLVCVDGRSTITRTPGEADHSGRVILDALYFKHVNGGLKIWASGDGQASDCP